MTLSLELRKTSGTAVRINFKASEECPWTRTTVHYCDGHHLHNLEWAITELLFDVTDDEEQETLSEIISHMYGFMETCDAIVAATLTESLTWDLEWRTLSLRRQKKARVEENDAAVDNLADMLDNVTTLRKRGRDMRSYLPNFPKLSTMSSIKLLDNPDLETRFPPAPFDAAAKIFIVSSKPPARPDWMEYANKPVVIDPNNLLGAMGAMAMEYDNEYPGELDVKEMMNFAVASETTRDSRIARHNCKKLTASDGGCGPLLPLSARGDLRHDRD